MNIRIILAAIALMLSSVATAQELNCKVKI